MMPTRLFQHYMEETFDKLVGKVAIVYLGERGLDGGALTRQAFTQAFDWAFIYSGMMQGIQQFLPCNAVNAPHDPELFYRGLGALISGSYYNNIHPPYKLHPLCFDFKRPLRVEDLKTIDPDLHMVVSRVEHDPTNDWCDPSSA